MHDVIYPVRLGFGIHIFVQREMRSAVCEGAQHGLEATKDREGDLW
jgi:hypothetical protein